MQPVPKLALLGTPREIFPDFESFPGLFCDRSIRWSQLPASIPDLLQLPEMSRVLFIPQPVRYTPAFVLFRLASQVFYTQVIVHHPFPFIGASGRNPASFVRISRSAFTISFSTVLHEISSPPI